MQRVPYLLVLGDKEMENQVVTVRTQKGEDLGGLQIGEFIELLKHDIADKK
jgi:threonyl-tRNA synthetase